MPSSNLVDFASTDLASAYTGFYAKVIDDAFTPEECQALVDLASTTPGGWQMAGVSAERPDSVHSEFRHSQRIVRIDEEAADKIFQRLKPFVEELDSIEPQGRWAGVTGKVGRKQGPTWKLHR